MRSVLKNRDEDNSEVTEQYQSLVNNPSSDELDMFDVSRESGSAEDEKTLRILPNDCSLNSKVPKTKKYTHHHVAVFILTFSSYALYHATRKTFSNTKFTMGQQWSPTNKDANVSFAYNYDQWNTHNNFKTEDSSKIFMGFLDLGFLFSYSIGLFLYGILGDRLNLRYVLTFGMTVSALTVFAFGCISKWANFTAKWYYVVIWCLNGFFQATGWPCTVAIIGSWFGRSSRGLILGIWSANASFGNIIGSYAVSGVLNFGYEYAYLVTSTMLLSGAIIIFFGLLTSPREIGLEELDAGCTSASDKMARFSSQAHLIDDSGNAYEEIKSEPKAMPFRKVIMLPGVIPYSLSYACLKPVNYAFFFWLPYYLSNHFHWKSSVSVQLSTWYDYGGIIGGIVFGYISDKTKFRSPILVLMLVISPITIYAYHESPNNKLVNSILMGLIGVFLNGAANILSTAITADLGRQDAIKDNQMALSTVTGIIDGTASFSAAIWQVFVPLINTHLGWAAVFYCFIALTSLSFIVLIPLLVKDIKSWRSSRRSTQ